MMHKVNNYLTLNEFHFLSLNKTLDSELTSDCKKLGTKQVEEEFTGKRLIINIFIVTHNIGY